LAEIGGYNSEYKRITNRLAEIEGTEI